MFRFVLAAVFLFNIAPVSRAGEHYTVRMNSSRDVRFLQFSPDGSELAIGTQYNIQFVSTANGDKTKTVPINSIAANYSADGSRFYAIARTSSTSRLLRVSDKTAIPFKTQKEKGFIGIRVGERNGKLIISHLDEGSPALESEQISVGDELVAFAHGYGPAGDYKSVIGSSAQKTTKDLAGLAGTYLRLKTIPKGTLEKKEVVIRRRGTETRAGGRVWKADFENKAVDKLAACITGDYHEVRHASSGNTAAAFRIRHLKHRTGLSAVSRDGKYYAWVGEFEHEPDDPRFVTVINNRRPSGGDGDAGSVAGAAADDLGGGGPIRRYFGAEVYDVQTRELVSLFPVKTEKTGYGKVHRGVDFTADSKQLVVTTGRQVHVHDIDTGNKVRGFYVHRPNAPGARGHTIYKSAVAQNTVAAASYIGTVRLVDLRSGRVKETIESGNEDDKITAVALSDDATKLAFYQNRVVHLVHIDSKSRR